VGAYEESSRLSQPRAARFFSAELQFTATSHGLITIFASVLEFPALLKTVSRVPCFDTSGAWIGRRFSSQIRTTGHEKTGAPCGSAGHVSDDTDR
jgi:hypothetical protein